MSLTKKFRNAVAGGLAAIIMAGCAAGNVNHSRYVEGNIPKIGFVAIGGTANYTPEAICASADFKDFTEVNVIGLEDVEVIPLEDLNPSNIYFEFHCIDGKPVGLQRKRNHTLSEWKEQLYDSTGNMAKWIKEKKKVPALSAKYNNWFERGFGNECTDYANYPEVTVSSNGRFGEYTIHCMDGKPIGRQTEANSDMIHERYYDYNSLIDFIVKYEPNHDTGLIPCMSAYKQLNPKEHVVYNFTLVMKDGKVRYMAPHINCHTERYDTIETDIGNISNMNPTKECESRNWSLMFNYGFKRGEEVFPTECYNPETKRLTDEDVQKLRMVVEEVAGMERKYGTNHMPPQQDIKIMFNLVDHLLEQEKKKEAIK